jgi:hypothetical protein
MTAHAAPKWRYELLVENNEAISFLSLGADFLVVIAKETRSEISEGA